MQKEHWFVVIAGILYGTITAGAQLFVHLGLSLFEISLYRALFVTLILIPVVLVKRKYLIRRDMVSFFAVYGLIGAVLELTMFAGISLGVPIAIVALLLYTQPVWTVIFGRLMLGEKITRTKIIAVGIGILGIFFLVRSWETESIHSFAGILCSVAAGMLLSLWVIWGRKSAIKKQHFVTTTFGWSGFAFLWLLLILPFASYFIPDTRLTRFSLSHSTEIWLYLLTYASIGGVVPHMFFYRGIEKISASVAGIILLLEPVSATVLAAVFFSQTIGIYIMIGGVLILLSNYFAIRESFTNF